MNDMTPWAQALLEATEKELAVQVAYNQVADALLKSGSASFSLKPFEKAKKEYVAALKKLHQESKLWALGYDPAIQGDSGSNDQPKPGDS